MDWLVQNGEVVNMVAIVVICGFIGFAIKTGCGGDDRVCRWIPIIVGVAGGILGLVYRYINPDYAKMDVLMAIASGIVSGLASTGVHQVVKQSAKGMKSNGSTGGGTGGGGTPYNLKQGNGNGGNTGQGNGTG